MNGKMNPNTSTTEMNNNQQTTLQRVTLPMFNYQEPEYMNHHGSAPHISVTESTPETQRKHQLQVPPASICSDASDAKEEDSVEGEKLVNVISHGQRGRMEDQRCHLNPSKSAPCSPQNTDRKSTASSNSGLENEAFLNILSNSQSRRMDDQRVSLPSLPGLDKERESSNANPESNYLCYMVSKVQGSRMDDQRCSLPQINTGKDGSDRTRSASLCTNTDVLQSKGQNPAEQDGFYTMISHAQQRRMDDQRCELKPSPKAVRKETQLDKMPNESTQKQEITGVQEEQFLQMMKHAQKGRMEEQRCSLPTSTPASPIRNGSALNNEPIGADTDAFFRTIATSQSRRLDDQRAELPKPNTSGTPTKKHDVQRQNALYRKESFSKSAPQITVTQSSPASSLKRLTRPVSHLEPGHDAPGGQVTVRVSMSFSSLQGLANQDQTNQFPELFLTLGAPGDNLMIPLSPVPGRRLSLSLNLVPKEEELSLVHPSPKKSRSGQSSPQDDQVFVNITQTVQCPTTPVRKGHKQKGKAKDKTTQDKGKKAGKKDKNGNKR